MKLIKLHTFHDNNIFWVNADKIVTIGYYKNAGGFVETVNDNDVNHDCFRPCVELPEQIVEMIQS